MKISLTQIACIEHSIHYYYYYIYADFFSVNSNSSIWYGKKIRSDLVPCCNWIAFRNTYHVKRCNLKHTHSTYRSRMKNCLNCKFQSIFFMVIALVERLKTMKSNLFRQRIGLLVAFGNLRNRIYICVRVIAFAAIRWRKQLCYRSIACASYVVWKVSSLFIHSRLALWFQIKRIAASSLLAII